MIDELKRIIMEKYHYSEEEYWRQIDLYSMNMFDGSSELIGDIERYVENRDPSELSIEAEMRIARDWFGGYGNGKH